MNCFSGDLESATQLLIERARVGRGGYVCLGNTHVLVSAQDDPELRDALDGAWAVFPDGAPIAWLQRRVGTHASERIAGPDLMARVCERGVSTGIRHVLFGSTEAVLLELRHRLERAYPGIDIVDAFSPSRAEVERDEPFLTDQIQTQAPQIVWCALGAPRQELWMARNAAVLAPSLLVGVGAAFDFIAGTKARAPMWMQRSGLEWAHRFASEPTRLAGRYLRTNTRFMLLAAGEVARSKGA